MIKSAITVSLVEQARGGPFVYWNGLADAFSKAKQFGYDTVEIFAPDSHSVDRAELSQLIKTSGLNVAAVGTGAGMVISGLSLTDPDPKQRLKAREFITGRIEFGAEFDAPAIIGSMQGRHGLPIDKATAIEAFALPDSDSAAAKSIDSFRKYFP